MIRQLQWLEELLNKRPIQFDEFYYDDILNYLNLSFEDDELDLNCLHEICGSFTKELLACKRKSEVNKWLNKIVSYIIMNIEVDSLIDEYFHSVKHEKN